MYMWVTNAFLAFILVLVLISVCKESFVSQWGSGNIAWNNSKGPPFDQAVFGDYMVLPNPTIYNK
jgi:hypothetical protein